MASLGAWTIVGELLVFLLLLAIWPVIWHCDPISFALFWQLLVRIIWISTEAVPVPSPGAAALWKYNNIVGSIPLLSSAAGVRVVTFP